MWKFLVPFVLIAGGAFALSLAEFIEWSSFTAGLFKISIGVGVLVLADRYVLTGVDTITELKNGNVAWGLGFLSLALMIMGALIGS